MALSTPQVPPIIWQTYRHFPLPARAAETSRSWRDMNPGWEWRFHDDAAAAAFIDREFPGELSRVYHSLPLGVMRADVWRYAVLHRHGGVYADIDTTCRTPIAQWGLDPTMLTVSPEGDRMHFCQWTMAAPPAHPFLKAVLDEIVRRAALGIDLRDEHFVHRHTGPGVWTDAIRQSLGLPGVAPEDIAAGHAAAARQGRLAILPAGIFGGGLVGHSFGGTAFGRDYASWKKERSRLLAAHRPRRSLLRRLADRFRR